MSWRYWSNAVEGDERKKPLDLLSVEVCIHAPVGLFAQALHLARITCMGRTVATGLCKSQQPRFVPNRIVIFPPILHGRRRIFGLRSAGSGQNPDSDQDDYTDCNPGRGNAKEISRDRETDNQNDEADQISTE